MDGSISTLPPDVRRHRFTSADVQAMIEAGVIREGEHRIELVGGELIEMAPQGPLHSEMSRRLFMWFARNLPSELDVAPNAPFRLSAEDEPEPEFFVLPASMNVNDARGPDALLVVEVAVSSLDIDLKVKAPIYARHRVREYWVVDAEARRTLVHKLGPDGAYAAPEPVAFDAPLPAPAGLSLRIADIVPSA